MDKNDKIIKITKNGPYIVHGGIPLIKLKVITDDLDYPYKWVEESRYQTHESYKLCRCGQSKNKPFCDGTHEKINFDGAETATKDSYSKGAKVLEGPDLILTDNYDLCAHTAFCTRAGGIGSLVMRSDDPEAKKTAIEEAANCDSGRLVVWDKETNEPVEPELELSIAVVEEPDKGVSGALWVRGGILIESADGTVYEIRNRVALCRCGKSSNKPFCNGTHIMAGFDDGDESIKG